MFDWHGLRWCCPLGIIAQLKRKKLETDIDKIDKRFDNDAKTFKPELPGLELNR
jgi:hypothetical protein